MRPNLEPPQERTRAAAAPEEPEDYFARVDETRNPCLINVGPPCECTDARCKDAARGGAGDKCGARKLVPKGEQGDVWCARCGHHTRPLAHVYEQVKAAHRRRMINNDRLQQGKK